MTPPHLMIYKLPKNKLTHAVVIFDPHFPYEDKRSYNAVLNYIDDTKPDVFAFGGDGVDLDVISNKAAARHVEGKRLLKDFTYAKNRLREVKTIVPDAFTAYLEGNHDERSERYVDDHPELEGMVEVHNALDLANTGWHWVPCWRTSELLTIGKANILHGNYIGVAHARKMVDNYGVNVFYGHTHDRMLYSKVLMGDNSTIMAQSCGFLGNYDAPYMRGNPSNWQQAFLDLWVEPNGHFYHSVVPIFNNKFVVNGKLYKG